VIGVLFVGLHI